MKNNEHVPYLINAYDGRQHINSYNDNIDLLFKNFMDKVLARLENGKTIFYAHNLASFDGIFILKHLIKYGKVEPILNNGKIISITLTVKGESKKDIKTLVFKDSYLMLPSSLRKLCTAFNVNTIKTNFPYLLDNIGCRAASGVFPKFQYWTGIDKAVTFG